ncbi:hypothetical protein CON23_21205 [Bacillus thuringiensis]|uniref:hypothetical protein n=1 Tax=Bacillus thuringiensis TaxID=1428 RepID=UPI000BED0000|nr:hypothetical protein [Bacillus thuringiensis]PEF10236.1 hypothetical protein CON23_21205 [Bacillus thuringiensis]
MVEDNDLKRCSICKKYKMLDHFHNNRAMHDGLDNACKPCNNVRRYTGQRSVFIAEIDGQEVECKKCNTCDEVKPLHKFHSNGANRGKYSRRGSCGPCEYRKGSERMRNSRAMKKALIAANTTKS